MYAENLRKRRFRAAKKAAVSEENLSRMLSNLKRYAAYEQNLRRFKFKKI